MIKNKNMSQMMMGMVLALLGLKITNFIDITYIQVISPILMYWVVMLILKLIVLSLSSLAMWLESKGAK